jgi:hypothetical protein
LTFNLDGHDPAFAYITELVTDVWVLRDGTVFFRGRVGPTSDVIDEDQHVVQINVFDYKEWLGRQIIGPGATLTWVNKTPTQIITDSLTYINAHPPTAIRPAITLDATKLSTGLQNFETLVGTTMKDFLAAMVGFGWQVVPTSMTALSLKCISPFYYNLNSYFVMEYGGAVKKITRNLNTGAYANEVFVSGDMALPPVVSYSSDIATNTRGPLGIVVSDPSILTATALSGRAAQELQNRNIVAATWNVELKPGAWINEHDAFLGDIVRFVVNSGRININDQYRITDLSINISDDGDQHTVSITLVRPPFVPTS